MEQIHARVLEAFGGRPGIRDRNALEASLAGPRMTFGGEDLYPTIVEKAAILGYLITVDQPFIDGNKRTGYAALEVFLVTNGYELAGTVDDKEQVMLAVAAHRMSREEFTAWVRTAVFPRQVRREHQA